MEEKAASRPMPPVPVPGGKRRAGVWTGLAVFMVVIALGLAFGGRRLYRHYHAYRGEKLAAQAMQLLREERWESASSLLHEGIRTYGQEPPVMRALASLFLDGFDDPLNAANLLRQVLASGRGTPEDMRHLAEALLKLGDLPEARRLYEKLPSSEQSAGQGLELHANILRRSGQAAEAEAMLRKALALQTDDPRSQLRLAELDESSGFEVSQSVASQAIWTLARRNDTVAVEAIDHLSDSRSLSAAQAQELLLLVERNPKATERNRLHALSACLRTRPLERDSIIAAEVAKNTGRSVSNMFDFLRWLGAEKQYDQIVKMVPASTALRDPDVFLVYVDALAAAERWSELLSLMQSSKVPASAATQHFISAECLIHLKPENLGEVRSHLESVYSQAGPGELQMLRRTADLSESKGLNDLAIIGYTRLAEARPSLRVGLLETIVELQARDKDLPAMLRTLKNLLELRPTSQPYADRLNYLRLISGEELELACDAVTGAERPASAEEDSATIPQPLLRALAALRLGDNPRMVREIQALAAPAKLAAGQRAVVAGLRALSGDDVGAYRLAEAVPQALLLEDEQKFLRQAEVVAK